MRLRPLSCSIVSVGLAVFVGTYAVSSRAQEQARYGIENKSDRAESLQERFTEPQLALIEKLNRADIGHLERLPEVV